MKSRKPILVHGIFVRSEGELPISSWGRSADDPVILVGHCAEAHACLADPPHDVSKRPAAVPRRIRARVMLQSSP
ncbi:hypothetical protein [Bradyrhizobium sp. STM 3809]|uniref:hypothetical protein n=1 Tax=Bradyrhizobium sp. STM 3809 TaxID=551936 RepID=UPI0003056B5F|nr:hypothetical protein [Bradyrhizobium sp. STM 3809]